MTNKNIITILSALLIIFSILVSGCGKRQTPPLPEKPVVEVEQPKDRKFVKLSAAEASTIARSITIGKQGMKSWADYSAAIERSAIYVSRKPQNKFALDKYGLQVKWKTLAKSLQRMKALLPQLDSNPELLAKHFDFYRLDEDPLFTGYYEPALQASLTRKAGYSYPIYGMPDDLKYIDLAKFHPRWKGQRAYYRIEGDKAVPYYDRKDIDMNGALKSRNLEIAWAKDPLDIFFLQIQGSGRLILEDGQEKHVLYAGKNGRKYVSLGRVLLKKGLLPKDGISMQAIRKFFEQNPERTYELLSTNPSYVFFRLSDTGPYGSIGQTLTPRVSLATDPSYLPLGGLLVFNVAMPEKDQNGKFQYGEELTGLGLAQDTGGAIKEHHLDFFSGYGEEATWIAGHMSKRGSAWLLLPKRN